MRPCCSLVSCGFRNRLQSIGVSVSETKPETRIATPMVTANSWNSRPISPPMNSTGMNTAASEMVIETNGEADLPRAAGGPPASPASPFSMWRTMFSSITIASSTTKPTDSVSAMSDRLSRL